MLSVEVLGDYIQGEFVRAKKPYGRIVSKDPGDSGYPIGSFAICPDHVDLAVTAARQALEGWQELRPIERADILRKFFAEVVNHRQELRDLISTETGKPLWESEEEVGEVAAQVETEIREGVRSVSPFRAGEIRFGLEGSCHFKPLGVMAVLGPAISPVKYACSQIIPALLTGCTVVFKPSKLVPATGQFIAHLFDEMALPPGVFNLVQGDAAVGSVLSAHPGVEGVLFTGSYPAGKRILQATAAQPHKLVAIQMGGVNVALVLDDADLDRAIYETTTGAFLTAGQRYTSTGVILIEKPLFERFTRTFLEVAQALKVGYSFEPGVFMGPVLSESARERFLDLQERMGQAGARPLLASKPLKLERPGFYLSPGVHTVERASEINTFRPGGLSFGPDVVLVPVSTMAHGIALANSTQFPYSAAVFCRDEDRFEACLRRLCYGMVNHNVATTTTSLRLPLGGIRQCGNHRPAGVLSQRNSTYPVATIRATKPFNWDRAIKNFPRLPRKK